MASRNQPCGARPSDDAGLNAEPSGALRAAERALVLIEQLAACHLEASNHKGSKEWERKAHAHAYGAAHRCGLILRVQLAATRPIAGSAEGVAAQVASDKSREAK